MEEERKLGSPEEKDASPAPETKPAASEVQPEGSAGGSTAADGARSTPRRHGGRSG